MVISGEEWNAVCLVVGDDLLPVCRIDRTQRRDLALVDALARLQLAARRLGLSICLHNPDRDLKALLELSGLADVVPSVTGRAGGGGRGSGGSGMFDPWLPG